MSSRYIRANENIDANRLPKYCALFTTPFTTQFTIEAGTHGVSLQRTNLAGTPDRPFAQGNRKNESKRGSMQRERRESYAGLRPAVGEELHHDKHTSQHLRHREKSGSCPPSPRHLLQKPSKLPIPCALPNSVSQSALLESGHENVTNGGAGEGVANSLPITASAHVGVRAWAKLLTKLCAEPITLVIPGETGKIVSSIGGLVLADAANSSSINVIVTCWDASHERKAESRMSRQTCGQDPPTESSMVMENVQMETGEAEAASRFMAPAQSGAGNCRVASSNALMQSPKRVRPWAKVKAAKVLSSLQASNTVWDRMPQASGQARSSPGVQLPATAASRSASSAESHAVKGTLGSWVRSLPTASAAGPFLGKSARPPRKHLWPAPPT